MCRTFSLDFSLYIHTELEKAYFNVTFIFEEFKKALQREYPQVPDASVKTELLEIEETSAFSLPILE